MIKKLLLAICVALPMCISAQTATKIGIVNTESIFSLMPEKKAAESSIAEVSKKYETEYQKLRDDFNQKYAEFQNLEATTPKTIKDRRMQELQENQQKIQSFQQMASQDIEKQQQELMSPIMDKINAAIKSIGDEEGFTMIFDMSLPNVIYAGSTAVDITSQVKTRLGLSAQ